MKFWTEGEEEEEVKNKEHWEMGFEEESVWCLNLDLDWGKRERLRLQRGKAIEFWMVYFLLKRLKRERIRENVCVIWGCCLSIMSGVECSHEIN